MPVGPFEMLGEEFANLAEYVAGPDSEGLVTVRGIDPDTGATLATAEGVTALKRSRRRSPFGVQGGGQLPADLCRFVLKADELNGIALKERDEVEEADGTVWRVDERGVEVIAFGSLVTCDVSKKQG